MLTSDGSTITTSPADTNEDMLALLDNHTNVVSNYKDWFLRFKQVLTLFKTRNISKKDRLTYQLFILEYGQYNANFTLEELKKLNYPNSPFVIAHRNTYLRATDTWAMEILSFLYRRHNSTNQKCPIWIDSRLFWKELNRYCNLIEVDQFEVYLLDYKHEWMMSSGCLSKPIWVKVIKKHSVDQIKKAQQSIRNYILTTVMNNKELPEILQPLFQAIQDNKRVKDISSTPKLLAALHKLFPDVKRAKENEIKDLKKELTLDKTAYGDAWYRKIFSLSKQYSVSLPDNLKSYKDLKNFHVNFYNDFTSFLNTLAANIKPLISISLYIENIKGWISNNNVATINKNLFKDIAFFYQDNFHQIEALVICDSIEPPGFIKRTMDHLGYRIDPVEIIRTILNIFPKLFIDAKQTQDFWRLLIKTSIIVELPNDFQIAIEELGSMIFSLIQAEQQYTIKYNPHLWESKLNFILEVKGNQDSEAFGLYADYLYNYLTNFKQKYNVQAEVRLVTDREIEQALENFLSAYHDDNLEKAIRAVQVISEIMLLDLELSPSSEKSWEQVIKENYFKNYPVQGAFILPYAMRTYTSVFQLLDNMYSETPVRISVTNQSYFELLYNLSDLNEQKGKAIVVKHLEDVDLQSDIIFVEIHPNNVVELKQYAHNVNSLITKMKSFKHHNKQWTLVIDATLNALGDEEIKNLLKGSVSLIDCGSLNIIIIQSLTKFAQLGLDKRSGGSVAVINNGINWEALNARIDEIKKFELADFSTINYFNYFVNQKNLLQNYYQLINRNVRFVYNVTLQQMNNLEIWDKGLLQITVSTDPKACYIALNMNGFLPEIDGAFSKKLEDVEEFSNDVLNHLVYPLCVFFQLPLTARASIGFPLSSINLVQDSIRLTIGLESNNKLEHYAEILAYVAFVLNRQWDTEVFFHKTNGKYILRKRLFDEKVTQFKAMTPGKDFLCEFSIKIGPNSLEHMVRIQNGQISIKQIMQNIIDEAQPSKEYLSNDIFIPTKIIGYSNSSVEFEYLPLNDQKVNLMMRRFAIACLTECYREELKIQNVNIHLDADNRPITLTTFKENIYWLEGLNYGPFYYGLEKVYFYLYEKQIRVIFNKEVYNENKILIKQGHTITPLAYIPLAERQFIFCSHTLGFRAPIDFPAKVPKLGIQYVPERSLIRFSKDDDNLTIECDFICAYKPGVTVYKRFIANSVTSIEIDYWGEKDPILARFLRLMTAVYVKEKANTHFSSRNKRFNHFLFILKYESVNVIFQEAIERVLNSKDLLKNLLNNQNQELAHDRYDFIPVLSNLLWPKGATHDDVKYIENKQLIEQGITILRKVPYFTIAKSKSNHKQPKIDMVDKQAIAKWTSPINPAYLDVTKTYKQ